MKTKQNRRAESTDGNSSSVRVRLAADIDMAKNPLQSSGNTAGCYRLLLSPGSE
ncbi:MAG: hypothetical protein JXQ81_13360 [Desulfuromonadales bacterium]|nr:hypothetical protein [Desulfuromonadales bacterium]